MNNELFLTLSFPIIGLSLWFGLPYVLFGDIGLIGAVFTFVTCWGIEYRIQNA